MLFNQFKDFSINLNAQHVNGMTQNLGGWNLISEFLLCEARFDRWENRVMRCFSVEFKVFEGNMAAVLRPLATSILS